MFGQSLCNAVRHCMDFIDSSNMISLVTHQPCVHHPKPAKERKQLQGTRQGETGSRRKKRQTQRAAQARGTSSPSLSCDTFHRERWRYRIEVLRISRTSYHLQICAILPILTNGGASDSTCLGGGSVPPRCHQTIGIQTSLGTHTVILDGE